MDGVTRGRHYEGGQIEVPVDSVWWRLSVDDLPPPEDYLHIFWPELPGWASPPYMFGSRPKDSR